MKKYCVKCGKQFESVGREVICPECRESAKLEAKCAAVLRAKRASWTGESVPVRISGRASTIIRRYGAANNLPFAAALDDLLKSTNYFKGVGIAWDEVTPYKSRRRDKHATETEQKVQEAAQEVKTAKPVKQAAKTAVKTRASKASKASTASKTAKK